MKGEGVIIAYFFTIQSFVGLFPFSHLLSRQDSGAISLTRLLYFPFHRTKHSPRACVRASWRPIPFSDNVSRSSARRQSREEEVVL